jgi:acetyl esterase/lipase
MPLTIAQIGDEKSHDSLLTFYADTTDMAVISIGYRLAPEEPFPKGPEDCYDASMCEVLKH